VCVLLREGLVLHVSWHLMVKRHVRRVLLGTQVATVKGLLHWSLLCCRNSRLTEWESYFLSYLHFSRLELAKSLIWSFEPPCSLKSFVLILLKLIINNFRIRKFVKISFTFSFITEEMKICWFSITLCLFVFVFLCLLLFRSIYKKLICFLRAVFVLYYRIVRWGTEFKYLLSYLPC